MSPPNLTLPPIYQEKSEFSQTRLAELRERISKIQAARRIPRLAIFVAGSYARLEASQYSDLDPFLICGGDRSVEQAPRTNELEMFGDLIRVGHDMNLPKFSADSKYLVVHSAEDIQKALGSPADDAKNHFTLRLLMMLESKPLFGDAHYNEVLTDFIDAYFRDYPQHQSDFEPTFLINDILRYWRTVLANYENKRNRPDGEQQQIALKVRNFKLKYSRLTTCFATVAAIAAMRTPVEPHAVLSLVRLTPHERLLSVASRQPETTDHVQAIIDGYADFLQLTELTSSELENRFVDKSSREALFGMANSYGDLFFKLIVKLDSLRTDSGRGILRTLVV